MTDVVMTPALIEENMAAVRWAYFSAALIEEETVNNFFGKPVRHICRLYEPQLLQPGPALWLLYGRKLRQKVALAEATLHLKSNELKIKTGPHLDPIIKMKIERILSGTMTPAHALAH